LREVERKSMIASARRCFVVEAAYGNLNVRTLQIVCPEKKCLPWCDCRLVCLRLVSLFYVVESS